MWSYGFYNSVNGDRLYNAQQMSELFEGLITDGIYESVGNKLAVQVNNGMTIQINTGRGWFGGHWVKNDSLHLLTLEASDVLLNRYCAVCVRTNKSESVRSSTPYLKYSDFATTPVKPSMERTETVKEYCLAYIYIPAGSSAITAANIEDTRGNNNLCGWVTGVIDQVDTTTLWEQYKAQWQQFMSEADAENDTWQAEQRAAFTEWYNGLVDLINENTETMLVNAIPVSLTVTLTTAGWVAENGLYKQTVTVNSMNATKSVVVSPNSETATVYSASEVRCTGQGANTLEFAAVTQPTEAIKVDVLHMGV